MRKILSINVNEKKSFAILSHFQRMGIIFFMLSLPYASFTQQNEKYAAIEGKLIKSIPSLKDFKSGLISSQTSLSKNRIVPSFDNLSEKLIDHGTKFKGDPVVQRDLSSSVLSNSETTTLESIPSTVDKNFDGIGFSSVTPASPSIAAGPNHVIQMINGLSGSYFKIWDRDGNVVIGQTILSSLFGGGGYTGEFDPIAIYDQFADRYMMTELGTVGGSILVNTLVIAISQTNDPTGGWNLYKFTDYSFYHDHLQFAAWPNALYATTNDFSYNGSFYTFLGASFYAIDKNQMVAGNLTVPLVRYRILKEGSAKIGSIGPVNISGNTPPSAGSPGMFMYFSDDNFTSSSTDVDSVGFISLQPDFATPENSVVSFSQQIAVAPFKSRLCNNFNNCIPAPGGLYDAVSDRFMHRIYYRNFGTHESIVANHTVDANYPNLPQKAGVRWYEFRRTGGEWSTYQQSTYSPDAQSRWMGSIGINSKGQIALSYNLASPTKFGSFYFTGRNSGDPLNQMSIADNVIVNGTGFGTVANRWGQQNDMATDVVNDSLFWTTAMYGNTFNTWKTRVAAIKIGDPPPPSVSINQSATQTDPTSGVPIHFTVVFSEAVTGFNALDISFTGSTVGGTLTAVVSGSGSTYEVYVSGITSSGNVVATIPAGAAISGASVASQASTSTDNTVAVVVTPHDLLVVKQAPATVVAGNALTYNMIVSNNSSSNIFDVTVIDALPPGLLFNSANVIVGPGLLGLPEITSPTVGQSGLVSIRFFGLTPGAQVNCFLSVTVDPNLTGSITNTATVSGPLGDVNPTNNTSTAITQIAIAPTITCPSNVTVNTSENNCLGIVDLGALNFTLTGTPGPTLRLSFKQANNSSATLTNVDVIPGTANTVSFEKGTTTITATASNGMAPNATCQFNIVVNDVTDPVITCPPPITVNNTDPDICTVTISNATIGLATAVDNCSGTITVTPSNFPADNKFPVGTTTIVWTATDASGNSSTCEQIITVLDNAPPVISGLSANPAMLAPPNHKMKDVIINYSVTDCSAVTNVLTISHNEGNDPSDYQVIDEHHVKLRAERKGTGDGRIYTITISSTDVAGNSSTETTTVVVAHNVTSPRSGAAFKVGSTVNLAGTFWDIAGNKHTATWLIDDKTSVKGIVTEPSGMKNGTVTGSYKFTTPGVYKLQMNITDQKGVTTYANTSGDLEAIVVIYDPNGGYTYGGGYFASPAGALKTNPYTVGNVSYGFTVNYYKTATFPRGETQFDFKLGEFEFNAVNFEYLSISGAKAQFKGTGKIIGGQSGINFIMTVIDGNLDGTGIDKVRIKIYNKNTGKIYYDNQPGASDADSPLTAVGSNSEIVVQNTNNTNTTSARISTDVEQVMEFGKDLELRAAPNPSNSKFNLTVRSNYAKEKITMQVSDMYGRIIEVRNILSGQTIELGERFRPGIYIVTIIQGNNHRQLKLVKLSK